jgi:hypothetical protein
MGFIEALKILKSAGYTVIRTDLHTDVGRVYKVNFSLMDRRGVISIAEAVNK